MSRRLCALAAKYRPEEARAATWSRGLGDGLSGRSKWPRPPAPCACGAWEWGHVLITQSDLLLSDELPPTAGRAQGAVHVKKGRGEGPTGGWFPSVLVPCPSVPRAQEYPQRVDNGNVPRPQWKGSHPCPPSLLVQLTPERTGRGAVPGSEASAGCLRAACGSRTFPQSD